MTNHRMVPDARAPLCAVRIAPDLLRAEFTSRTLSLARKSSPNRPLFFIGMRAYKPPLEVVPPDSQTRSRSANPYNEGAKVSKPEIIAFPTYTH